MPYRNCPDEPKVGDEVYGIGELRLDEQGQQRMTTGIVSHVSAVTGKISVKYLHWDGQRVSQRIERGKPLHFDKL